MFARWQNLNRLPALLSSFIQIQIIRSLPLTTFLWRWCFSKWKQPNQMINTTLSVAPAIQMRQTRWWFGHLHCQIESVEWLWISNVQYAYFLFSIGSARCIYELHCIAFVKNLGNSASGCRGAFLVWRALILSWPRIMLTSAYVRFFRIVEKCCK